SSGTRAVSTPPAGRPRSGRRKQRRPAWTASRRLPGNPRAGSSDLDPDEVGRQAVAGRVGRIVEGGQLLARPRLREPERPGLPPDDDSVARSELVRHAGRLVVAPAADLRQVARHGRGRNDAARREGPLATKLRPHPDEGWRQAGEVGRPEPGRLTGLGG